MSLFFLYFVAIFYLMFITKLIEKKIKVNVGLNLFSY